MHLESTVSLTTLDFEQEVAIDRASGESQNQFSSNPGMTRLEQDRHQEKENIKKMGALLETIEVFQLRREKILQIHMVRRILYFKIRIQATN
jgi:hypothetical protein